MKRLWAPAADCAERVRRRLPHVRSSAPPGAVRRPEPCGRTVRADNRATCRAGLKAEVQAFGRDSNRATPLLPPAYRDRPVPPKRSQSRWRRVKQQAGLRTIDGALPSEPEPLCLLGQDAARSQCGDRTDLPTNSAIDLRSATTPRAHAPINQQAQRGHVRRYKVRTGTWDRGATRAAPQSAITQPPRQHIRRPSLQRSRPQLK
jgi:hypothetical protein